MSVKLYDTATEAESNIDFRVINLARMKVTMLAQMLVKVLVAWLNSLGQLTVCSMITWNTR